MISVKTCVIPAAGQGNRWTPLSKYIPKEMLPIGSTPVIGLVIQEAIASGCNEIVIVLDKKKKIIEKYLLEEVINKNIKLRCIYLDNSPGMAYSILQAKPLIGNKPFALMMPDMPAIYRKPHLLSVIDTFKKNGGKYNVVSVASYPKNNIIYYGEVFLKRDDKLLKVSHVCPRASKPGEVHHTGNTFRLSCRYVYNQEVFSLIEKGITDPHKIEFDPIIFAVEGGSKTIAVRVGGYTTDTGKPTEYIKSNVEYLTRKIS